MGMRRILGCTVVLCLLAALLAGHAGALTLKSTNEAKWIDRIDSLPEYGQSFYSWLEAEGAKGINGALADPTKAEYYNGEYVYRVPYQASEEVDLSLYGTEEEKDAAIQASINGLQTPASEWMQVLMNVYLCYIKDHPEIFWLTGEIKAGMTGTVSITGTSTNRTVTLNTNILLKLSGGGIDIRTAAYQDTAALNSAIQARDNAVSTIAAGASGSRYEKLVYLNDWLTKNNGYNSSSDLSAIDADCRSCLSALTGRCGAQGPVCEGYAEAFKVLCDQLGIPCIVVTGLGIDAGGSGEAHMWNQVQMEDGNWYGVDVTWNDPVVYGKKEEKISGAENQNYLLVGETTLCGSLAFGASHQTQNQISAGGQYFLNDPALASNAYTPGAEHTHSYTSLIVAPTCITDGCTVHTCSCGDSYTDTVVPALGHSYEAVVTAPTCTEDGYTTYTCSCGDSYTDDTVSALKHSWGDWGAIDLAYHSRSCNRSGCTAVQTDEHRWVPRSSKIDVCSICGQLRPRDHTHTYTAVVTEPTCTADGYTTYTCSCGHSYTDDTVPALGHDYESKVIPPTCLMNGYTNHTCKRCGDNYFDNVVDTVDHSFEQTVVPPTCTEEGYTIHTCSGCGFVYHTDQVPAAHTYETEVTPPTCIAVGYTTCTCTVCGHTEKKDYVAALAHNTVTDPGTEPTCTEAGLSEGIHCDRCGEILTAQYELPALGHDWGQWDKTDPDVHSRVCQREGCTEQEEQPHNWMYVTVGHYACTDCGRIRPAVSAKVDGTTLRIAFVKDPDGLSTVFAAVYLENGAMLDVKPMKKSGSEWTVELDQWKEGMTVKAFYLNDQHIPVRKNETITF